MSKEYRITAIEVSRVEYFVSADSKGEAIKKYKDGNADCIGHEDYLGPLIDECVLYRDEEGRINIEMVEED